MESWHFVFFICVFSNVICQAYSNDTMYVNAVYGMGFSMLIMFIIIICLCIALYMIWNNKTIFGININKKAMYVRQESAQGVTAYTYSNVGNDVGRNDGSTLTVNSGIVEIGGLVEPETPTRLEPNEEKKPPCIKKPIMPIMPTMKKAQMDDIIKQVLLNKRPERGSSTLRELDAFTNQKITKDNVETTFAGASTSSNDTDVITDDNQDESLYENLPVKQAMKSPNERKKQQIDAVDGVKNVEGEDEQEVYDTLPNPVRYMDGNVKDSYHENLHVYDCPPRKSWERSEQNNVVLDQDTDYLLLVSKPRGDDETSYINARPRKSP